MSSRPTTKDPEPGRRGLRGSGEIPRINCGVDADSGDSFPALSRTSGWKGRKPRSRAGAVIAWNPEEKHPGSSKRTPCISMAEENVSGSLHSASVATAPSSSVEMTKCGLHPAVFSAYGKGEGLHHLQISAVGAAHLLLDFGVYRRRNIRFAHSKPALALLGLPAPVGFG
jgi:hypothetical protein